MIVPKLTRYRILRTMTTDMRNVFLHTASELNELGKELIDATNESFKHDSISVYVSTDRAYRIVSEFADVLVMLVALQDCLQIDSAEIMADINKVCERYEQQ